MMQAPFVDIHCHLLPQIDDGANDLESTLAMARMAVDDGIGTIIATPHQQGNFSTNRGEAIRHQTAELQQQLTRCQIPLRVLPGADVRIEEGMLERLASGEVLTLGDHHRHVLLELPHELYFPIESLLNDLRPHGLVGILSHPERNRGLLNRPELIGPLVDQGCLMQITAGSLMGSFGSDSKQMAERMLSQGMVHFLATDAHGPKRRRPLMGRAYHRVCDLTNDPTAKLLCMHNPARVAQGEKVDPRLPSYPAPARGWSRLFTRKKAG